MTTMLRRRLEALEGPREARTCIRWIVDGREQFQVLGGSGALLDVAPAGARVVRWPVCRPVVEVGRAHA